MNHLNDGQLVKRACQRKADAQSAFAVLFKRYERKIAAYVCAKVNYNQAYIDDVIQDTFTTAWKNIHQLQDPERFFQWIVTISRNNAMDVLRRKTKTDDISDVLGLDAVEEHVDMLHLGETETILAHLAPDERETVVYKAILEYSFEEIAAELQQSVSAVKMRYYRAMERLKHAVKQDD